MADLPTPLITEILSRIPVKFLLRFRCVSKSWRSLIDDSYFVKLHLKRSMENTTNQTLILRDSYLYSVEFPTLDRAVEIDHPLKCDSFGTELLGSCNGLLCLSNGEEKSTIFYNPATKKHRVLPVTTIEFPDNEFVLCCERIVYGFGYDEINDDYKLVRIIQFDGINADFTHSEVKIYSLKSNSWRRVRNFPYEYYLTYKRGWGVYVNGFLHWVVTWKPGSDGSKLIVAYDLGSEECKVVPQPRDLGDEVHMNVNVLQGCLCLLSNYVNDRTEVWVMKEYGVMESWTKLFTVSQSQISGSFEYVKPIAFSNNGSEVLLEQDLKNLIWFDLSSQRAKRVSMWGMPTSFEAEMLVESLVHLDNHKKKKRKRPKKKRNDQSGQANSRLETLPLALLFNILSRLPAKILLQFKRVSKACNNLICEPGFAKIHLEVSGKSSDNLFLLIREEKLHFIDFNLLNKAVQINHPLTSPEGWTDIIGLCNGLLCLSNPDRNIALWNPLTGSSHKLPITEFPSQEDSSSGHVFIYGFGYDPINDDYKVVQILQPYFSIPEVQIYSLKNKYWRRVQSFPYILCYSCQGVLASGALHWVVSKRHNSDSTSYLIMSFDLGLEECREVSQPQYEDIYFHMSLGLLGGSLCILCHYPKKGVDMWVLKDYERQSWSKLISITQPKPIKYFEYVKPLAYSKNGMEVLLELDYEKLIWYNLKKKTIRHVNVSDLPNSLETEVFYGSLLNPDNVGGNFEIGQQALNANPSNSLAVFPDKLLSLILSRLPVKTLLHVQRVCKTWYNLVNDPEFIKMHLEVLIKCNSSLSLFLKGDKVFSVNFQLLNRAIEVKHPLVYPEGFTDIVGSSNGLISLCKEKDCALWNPWTGKYEILPDAKFHYPNASNAFHSLIHGFGYDPTSDDYKVVRVLQMHESLKGGIVHSKVQVYSLKTNSWGCVNTFPYIISYPCSGVLASGALHWVARQSPELYSSSSLLVAFDLGMEKCRVVTQPSYVDTDFHTSLGLLRGCLCLLCHYPRQSVDLWVMTDYGAESWTRLFSISQPKIIKRFEYLKPLAYSEDGTEVLLEQDNEKLLWFNLTKKTVKYVKIDGLPKSFETVMCSRSLVHVSNVTRKCHVILEQAREGFQNRRDKKERNELDGFLTKGFKLKL